jgi:3,4-dihydroxy 2-butanone 4-phosphate synthase/GTP cyclohydrolase II
MPSIEIEKTTCARIPTEVGTFQLCLYRSRQDNKEHLALIAGDVTGKDSILVRVHSECFTGDVLGSLRCDCGPQLNQAMRLIAAEGQGIVLYLRQEGRGIGLPDKLRAYNLQDQGYDTVDANLMLGHQADARDYTVAALILQDLGVRSLRLLTNNPLKVESLEALGITVTERVPLQTAVHEENATYLATKVERMRHLLNLESTGGNGHHPTIFPETASFRENQRPTVTLSYAQSLDGSITAHRGQPTAISGPDSMTMTHQLRAEHDAILVGVNTIIADDPQLTVRLVDGRSPQPIILDSCLRTPRSAQLLQNGRTPWIATTEQADPAHQAELEAAGARILRLPANANGQVDLALLLDCLAQEGIHSLMVEGGAGIITGFLSAQLVDRVVLTIAPLFIGGVAAVGRLLSLNGEPHPRLRNVQYQTLGEDIVISGNVIWK